MAITINWGTKVINVPQADLTPLGGVFYELDIDWFRLQLKNLEDSEEGMVMPDTHRHNTEVELSGVIYARFVEVINGYTVQFQDGQYVVTCVGANHNLADVKTPNQVSLIIGNAAGLIVAETGTSGLTPGESEQLMKTALEDGGRLEDIDGMAVKILGLVQHNFRLKSQVYDGDKNLISATVRIYASSADAQADANPIGEYELTASYVGPGEQTSYVMAEV
jgi:hypothetical protein